MNNAQYQRVTDRIAEMLAQGVRPWAQQWNAYAGGGRPLRSDGQGYRGANVLNLWAAAMERKFTSPYWLTYKTAQKLGAQVKKGARSELAFYVGSVTRERDNGDEYSIAFLKAYCVFNAEEVEGLASHFYRPAERSLLDVASRVPAADQWVAATSAKIIEGGGRAFYRPSTDEIHLPEFGSFDSAAAYYSTACHELTHWTGAATRLDRGKGNLFGSPEYAFEELIAELGAAYAMADLRLSATVREDHASYIAGWLRCLRDDNKAIFRAASFAEKAVTFLHGDKNSHQLAEAAD